MTIIVGIANEGKVYIGGDRGYSDGDILVPALSAKVFNKGNYLLGFAGNAGIGQNICYTFNAPVHKTTTDIYTYIYNYFIPAFKDHLKDSLSEKEGDQASFILGYKGKVFEIDTGDFQCVEYDELCIGSGAAYGYGSLHTTYTYDISTEDRVRMALDAAITYSPTCQGPVDILSI